MNVPAKLAGFGLILVAAFGAGAGIGAAVGPLGDDGGKPHHVMTGGMATPRLGPVGTSSTHADPSPLRS